MVALLLALALGQATVEIRVTVRKPLCVVLDASGAARVVPKRALTGEERVAGCAAAPGNAAPRVEQLVEGAGAAERVVQISY